MPLPEDGKLKRLINQATKGYIIVKNTRRSREVWNSTAKKTVTVPITTETLVQSCYCLSRGLTKRCPTHQRELRPQGIRAQHFAG